MEKENAQKTKTELAKDMLTMEFSDYQIKMIIKLLKERAYASSKLIDIDKDISDIEALTFTEYMTKDEDLVPQRGYVGVTMGSGAELSL